MEYVEPIRDKSDIEAMKAYLKNWNQRNYLMFLFGINTGLRISDILNLKVKDVMGWHITIREKKTGKSKKFKMPPKLKNEIKLYIQDKPLNVFLFKSRQGKNQPINRRTADWILKKAAWECGLDHIGTHSMRKTFGYHYYKKTKDVATLMAIFNHDAPSITLRYIGINQDHLDKAMSEMSL